MILLISSQPIFDPLLSWPSLRMRGLGPLFPSAGRKLKIDMSLLNLLFCSQVDLSNNGKNTIVYYIHMYVGYCVVFGSNLG